MAANPRPIAAARRFVEGLHEVGAWLSRPSNRWELRWSDEPEQPGRGSGSRGRVVLRRPIIMCDGVDYKHSLS